MYLDMNLFMTPPTVAMQGKMEDIARASLQDRIYARMKPNDQKEIRHHEKRLQVCKQTCCKC